DVTDGEGARADEAHVAHQHVCELRQLVEAQAAQHAAEAGAARVFLDLEYRSFGLVQVLEIGLELLGVDDHRPELVRGEPAPIEQLGELDQRIVDMAGAVGRCAIAVYVYGRDRRANVQYLDHAVAETVALGEARRAVEGGAAVTDDDHVAEIAAEAPDLTSN